MFSEESRKQKQAVRILGVDPGYARTGYAILDCRNDQFRIVDYGLINTEPDLAFSKRLLVIDRAVNQLVDLHKPDVMAIEEVFFHSNRKTAMGTAQARGVIIVAAARKGLDVYEYTPLQVKLAVTGYGRAEKKQVQSMVKVILKLKEVPQPDDVADAIAIAICHGHSGNKKNALVVGGYK